MALYYYLSQYFGSAINYNGTVCAKLHIILFLCSCVHSTKQTQNLLVCIVTMHFVYVRTVEQFVS